jgi:hypothetical protein
MEYVAIGFVVLVVVIVVVGFAILSSVKWY